MIDTGQKTEFYPPDTKEMGLGICLILERVGGCLSQRRVAELVGEHLQVPESTRYNVPSCEVGWSRYVALSTTHLRKNGFVAQTTHQTRGMCILTAHGHELGQWAKRIYARENPVLPDWVEAFLTPLKKRIKNLLAGGTRRRAPDYELCRWVWYCYLLNWPEQGVAVFSRILSDNVEPPLYRQAERRARVMRGRLEERPTHAEPTFVDSKILKWISGIRADIRKWAVSQYPVGARIPTLRGDTYHEIQGYKRAGIRIHSAPATHERIVQWDNVTCFFLRLCKERALTLQSMGADGDFLCSLLAELTGAVIEPETCAVRLVDDNLWNVFDRD